MFQINDFVNDQYLSKIAVFLKSLESLVFYCGKRASQDNTIYPIFIEQSCSQFLTQSHTFFSNTLNYVSQLLCQKLHLKFLYDLALSGV